MMIDEVETVLQEVEEIDIKKDELEKFKDYLSTCIYLNS